jgi:hypothetical protein
VIEAEQVQDRGVEVVDVDRVFDDVVAEIVGLAVDRASLGSASGHPHGEAAWMMIAAVVLFGESPLRIDRAAEFAAPDHQGFVEQAALLEILDQGVARLIDIAALAG